MPSTPLIPKIPPIRTDIQEPQQSSALNRPPAQGASNGANTASNGSAPQHRTAKEWYYYWSKVGDQVVQNTQTLSGLVTYGPHAGRPDPSTMPDGAIAVESDRGVIYQREIIQGTPVWRYLAGTMWGTLSPDQRPTDLGVHDAGFQFRSTDQPPREFLWSGGAWVETTPARYDTHANRLAQPVANFSEGSLWVETDRSNVIYQLQGTVWQFLAGTMWGTISPDQRPTDLGVHDAGFHFRGTDQPREFIWSGGAWVEVTPVTGGGGLVDPNVVTKVGSAGQVVEGGITDLSAANSSRLYISAAGSVGIGTTSPSGLFQVNGGRSYFTGGGTTTAVALQSGPGTPPLLLGADGGGTLIVSDQTGALIFAIAQGGQVGIYKLPSTNPGAGSKQIWYDPSDSNRVKFAP